MESFTELRCPACVQLGWQSSRLLLKVSGKMTPMLGVEVEMKCHRCKSVISWHFGTPILLATEFGPKNRRMSRVAFE